MFVTDLDNTLVGNDAALLELNQNLGQHRKKYETKIVYATGRSLFLYQQLKREKKLLDPDALIAAVGTEIYINGSQIPDTHWSEKISAGWDEELVLSVTGCFPELIPQSNSEQNHFKVSFQLNEADAARVIPQLKLQFRRQHLDIKILYSSGIDLDIIPVSSDKGQAMQFLRQKWGFIAEDTVACGDSGNDIALFAIGEEKGIIVGNARPELLEWHRDNPGKYCYLAKNTCAGGIIEGLKYFGLME